MQLSNRIRRDGGFTLVELLITVVILGVITLPLGNLVIEYFTSTTQTTARLAESHDAQIAAAYFAQDTASAGRRDANQLLQPSIWAGTPSGAPYDCGSGTPVVLFAWDEFDSTDISAGSTVIEVGYVINTVGSERQLQRVYCGGPGTAPVTTVLGHELDPGTAPSVVCLLNGSVQSCDLGGASTPTTVKLTLTMKDSADSGNYEVTLTGQRRQT